MLLSCRKLDDKKGDDRLSTTTKRKRKDTAIQMAQQCVTRKHLQAVMPHQEDCVWTWITTNGVLLRHVFLAAYHIVPEARLMIDADGLELVSQPTKDRMMEVGFRLDASRASSPGGVFHMGQRSLMIPIDLRDWTAGTRTIRAQDLVGVCVKKSTSHNPTLDLYVVKPGQASDYYEYRCRHLKQEWMHFGVPRTQTILKRMGGGVKAVMDSARFRTMLTNLTSTMVHISMDDDRKDGPTLCFASVDGTSSATSMRFRVCATPHRDVRTSCEGCRDNQPNQIGHMGRGGCLAEESSSSSSDDEAGDQPSMEILLDAVEEGAKAVPTASSSALTLPSLVPPPPPTTKPVSLSSSSSSSSRRVTFEDETYAVDRLLRTTRAIKAAPRVELLYKSGEPLVLMYPMAWGMLTYMVCSRAPPATEDEF